MPTPALPTSGDRGAAAVVTGEPIIYGAGALPAACPAGLAGFDLTLTAAIDLWQADCGRILSLRRWPILFRPDAAGIHMLAPDDFWPEFAHLLHPRVFALPGPDTLQFAVPVWRDPGPPDCSICQQVLGADTDLVLTPCCSIPLHRTCWLDGLRHMGNHCHLCRGHPYTCLGVAAAVVHLGLPSPPRPGQSLAAWLSLVRPLLPLIHPHYPQFIVQPLLSLHLLCERLHVSAEDD